MAAEVKGSLMGTEVRTEPKMAPKPAPAGSPPSSPFVTLSTRPDLYVEELAILLKANDLASPPVRLAPDDAILRQCVRLVRLLIDERHRLAQRFDDIRTSVGPDEADPICRLFCKAYDLMGRDAERTFDWITEDNVGFGTKPSFLLATGQYKRILSTLGAIDQGIPA